MIDKNGACDHHKPKRDVWKMLYDDHRGRMWECRDCGKQWGYKP